jgi:hypothetical protein
MRNMQRRSLIVAVTLASAIGILSGCSQMKGMMGSDAGSRTQNISLSGANQVPAVTTSATGSGTITVNADRTVVARVSVTGMTATAAHIHTGAPGANGPVAVGFTKGNDNTFVAPDGARMTEEQYAAYKAGNTYVNVHSAKNPGGEIRAQLKGN